MAAGLGKSSKIRHIVRLRQLLRRWRQKAASHRSVPSDVPAGHVAVLVGSSGRRFVVRTTYLSHPVFQSLLAGAEEEYGFSGQTGPLTLPCDELLFEDILRFISQSDSSSSRSNRLVNLEDFQRYCHAGIRGISESRPLLSQI